MKLLRNAILLAAWLVSPALAGGQEASRAPAKPAEQAAGPKRAELELLKVKVAALLKRFDANRDGKIDRAEFQIVFDRLDLNQDGFLDRTELHQAVTLLSPSADNTSAEKTSAARPAVATRPLEQTPGSLDFRIFEFVKQFDINKDSKLDRDECEAMFRRLDRNRDDALDEGELLAGVLLAWPRATGEPASAAPVAGSTPAARPATESRTIEKRSAEGVAVQTSLTPEQLADAVLRDYDTNKDGKIDAAEARAALARLDRNRDGALDRDEVVRFFAALVAGRSETPAAAPAAAARTTGNAEERVDAVLRAVDTDKDGRISREEAKGTAFEKVFDRIDTNRDGFLDRDELLRDAARFYPAQGTDAPAGQGQHGPGKRPR